MSAIYGESDAFKSPSLWTVPKDASPLSKKLYTELFAKLKKDIAYGVLDPLAGNLRTAYDGYIMPEGLSAHEQSSLTRDDTMPASTHYKVQF